MLKRSLLLFLGAFLAGIANGQSVNPSTGKLDYAIPIWNAQSKDISYPIVLNYSSIALKVGQPAGSVGMGWSLSNEAYIVRIVKGLPDDLDATDRKGWLHGMAQEVQNFNPSADDNYSIATDETSDYNDLDAFGEFDQSGLMHDTEPDIFFVNVPGIGGHFAFDENGEIVFGRNNLNEFSYTADATNQSITAFQITTNNGITYNFGSPERTTVEASLAADEIPIVASDYYQYAGNSIEYTKKWYLKSITSTQGGLINFEYVPLTIRIGDHNYHVNTWGSKVQDDVNLYTTDEDYNSVKTRLYRMSYEQDQQDIPLVLLRIRTESHDVDFINGQLRIPDQFDHVTSAPVTKEPGQRPVGLRQPLLNAIRIYQRPVETSGVIIGNDDYSDNNRRLLNHFVFNYHFYKSKGDVIPAGKSRSWFPFLTTLTQGTGVNYNRPLSFEYYNTTDDEVYLPNSFSTSKDIFGHYNGIDSEEQDFPTATNILKELPEVYIYPDLPENEKYRYSPIPDYSGSVYKLDGRKNSGELKSLLSGVLKKIKKSEGGSTSIIYEKNNVYDARTARNEYAGGLRVKTMVTYDGLDHNDDITINYDYYRPSGNSSGKLLSKPLFAQHVGFYLDPSDTSLVDQSVLNQWSEKEYWKRTTLRSSTDQSSDVLNYGGVLYDFVTQNQPGKGKVVYEYDVPMDHLTTNVSQWSASKSRLARPSITSGSYSDIRNFIARGNYPPSMNTTYNYLNGQLIRTTSYNEAGQLLSITNNTYNYDFPYKELKGIRRELSTTQKTNGTDVDMYVYTPYTLRMEVSALQTLQTSSTYEYKNGIQKVVTSQRENVFDGQDYPVLRSVTNTDLEGTEYSTHYSYNQDYSAGTGSTNEMVSAIERMSNLSRKMIPIEIVQKIKKVGQASFVSGANINRYKFLPGDKLISDGTESLRINGPINDYTVFSINEATGQSTEDLRLIRNFKVVGTDDRLNVTSLEGRNNTFSSTIYGYNGRIPIIQFSGATEDEVAFANFEEQKTLSNPLIMGFVYPYGSLVAGRETGNAFSYQVGDNFTTTRVKRESTDSYVISFWYKSSGTVAVTTTADDTNVTESVTWSLPPAADWAYTEKKVDVSSLNGSITFDISANTTGLVVDDIIVAPSSSSYSYSTYDDKLRKVVETNHLGLSTYYEYDDLERPTIVRNHKKFIVKSNRYSVSGNDLAIEPVIKFSGRAVAAYPSTFEILNIPDPTGFSFYWEKSKHDASNLVLDASEVVYNLDSVKNDLTTKITFDDFLSSGEVYAVYLKAVSSTNTYYTHIIIDNTMIKPPPSIFASLCYDGPLLLDRCPAQVDGPDTGSCDISGGGDILFEVEVFGGSGSFTYTWFLSFDTDINAPCPVGAAVGGMQFCDSQISTVNSPIFEFDRLIYSNDTYLYVEVKDNVINSKAYQMVFIDFYESTPFCAQQ